MARTPIVLAMTLASGACAGATTQAGRASCVLAPADSTYLARGPVYPDCAVDRRARLLTTTARPDFRPSGPPPGGEACYSAQVQFVVDSAGRPEVETARVVRTNNSAYAEAILAILPLWRYQPALKDGIAVRQIVRQEQAMAVQVVRVRAGDIPRAGRSPRC